jgi:hypothetical protein
MKKHLKLSLPILLASIANVHGGSTGTQDTDSISMSHRNYSGKAHSPADSAVYLSSPTYTFDAFFTALILQPTGSSLHYAAQAHPYPPFTSPYWHIHDVHTDYHFGFDVGLGGVFHRANSDLFIDWEHYRSKDSSHKTVASDDMVGPFFEIGPDASAYKKTHGNVVFHFDQVNLDYGQFVNFGKRLQTNLYAGVSFARIKQTLHSKFSDYAGDIVRNINVPSLFTGGGPQLGLDFTYRIVNGFHFVGEAAGSLFVGTARNHTNFKAAFPASEGAGIASPNKQSTHVNKRTQVVPALEGKLGLDYAYLYRKHYMIKLEAGYQVQVYFNAIQSTDIGSEVVTPPVAPDVVGVYARTFQRNISNFSLAGPYVKVELGF